jgi:hypothetical protein
MSTTNMSTGGVDSQIMNYVVRMIVPLRREFGRSLDVAQFLHDFAYAREVMEQALGSQDARLREYAAYVQQRYHGPRVADSPTAASSAEGKAAEGRNAPIKTAAATPETSARSTEADEAELRARMLKKYTDGLR